MKLHSLFGKHFLRADCVVWLLSTVLKQLESKLIFYETTYNPFQQNSAMVVNNSAENASVYTSKSLKIGLRTKKLNLMEEPIKSFILNLVENF